MSCKFGCHYDTDTNQRYEDDYEPSVCDVCGEDEHNCCTASRMSGFSVGTAEARRILGILDFLLAIPEAV
jgi:hypothetical protein